MSIRRGEAWGESGPLPADGIVAATNAEVRDAVERAMRDRFDLPAIGLLGGDLCTTLGGRGNRDRLSSDSGSRTLVDVGRVFLDETAEHWFVAHLVARRSWWHGRVLAVMNAAWIGAWNVAPRAHPGDGAFDVIDANPSFGDRWKARRRLPSGTHVPHPAIGVHRARLFEVDLGRSMSIRLDGVEVGRARRLRIAVLPDALAVVV